MQDKQSIFDELVSQLSRELPPVIHVAETLPSGVDDILLTVSAFWAWLFVCVLILNKEAFGLKKWLEKNCELPSLRVAVVFLFAFSLLSFFHEPALSYFLNNPLIVATLLGFPILIKRMAEMREQTRISREQLQFSQFADAYGKLWSVDLGTRMTAIESLWNFAQEHPQEQYHKVMDTFTQFIKHPASYEWEEGKKEKDKKAGSRTDITAILWRMGERRMAGAAQYDINFSGAYLEGAYLGGARLEQTTFFNAHLKEANLIDAHLERATLWGADLKGVAFFYAHLEGASLGGADLDRSYFYLTIINEANFVGTKNLTQEQIKDCVFITDCRRHKERPKLPEGFEHNYRSLTFKEWEKDRKDSLSSS